MTSACVCCALDANSKTSPPGIKDFMCELCGKTFSERTTLETHKLIHTGKTPTPGHQTRQTDKSTLDIEVRVLWVGLLK